MSDESKTELSPDAREIALHLGTAFSALTAEFLPAVTEALERAENDREITFGATVKLKKQAGVIVCHIKPHEPKIPTPQQDSIYFLLQKKDDTGQLSFLFPGTLKELRVELADRDVKPEDDGYVAGDNANPA